MKIAVVLNLCFCILLLVSSFMYFPNADTLLYSEVLTKIDELMYTSSNFYLWGTLVSEYAPKLNSIFLILFNFSLLISIIYSVFLLNNVILRKTIIANCGFIILMPLLMPTGYPDLWFFSFIGYFSLFLEGMIFAVYILQAKPSKDDISFNL